MLFQFYESAVKLFSGTKNNIFRDYYEQIVGKPVSSVFKQQWQKSGYEN